MESQGFLQYLIKKHILKGTEEALGRISKMATEQTPEKKI